MIESDTNMSLSRSKSDSRIKLMMSALALKNTGDQKTVGISLANMKNIQDRLRRMQDVMNQAFRDALNELHQKYLDLNHVTEPIRVPVVELLRWVSGELLGGEVAPDAKATQLYAQMQRLSSRLSDLASREAAYDDPVLEAQALLETNSFETIILGVLGTPEDRSFKEREKLKKSTSAPLPCSGSLLHLHDPVKTRVVPRLFRTKSTLNLSDSIGAATPLSSPEALASPDYVKEVGTFEQSSARSESPKPR